MKHLLQRGFSHHFAITHVSIFTAPSLIHSINPGDNYPNPEGT